MAILTWLLGAFLSWLESQLVAFGLKEAKQVASDADKDTIANQDATALKNAKTDQDKANAAKSINNNLFGS